KVPGVSKKLSEQVVAFVQALRKQDVFKSPGVAETLDCAAALSELDVVALDPATVSDTLGVLLKYQDDIAKLEGSKVKELLDEVKSEMRAAEKIGSVHSRARVTCGECRNGRDRRPARRKHRLLRPRAAGGGYSGGSGRGSRL